MINAARTAAAEGVDTLIGDTNIYGESAPRAAERATRSATRGEDLPGFQQVQVGSTSRSGAPLDRVYSSSNSHLSVAAAGRILSNSGSSSRGIAARGDDVTVHVDAATQAALNGSTHVPIYADLERPRA
jgi:hypothetical protein